MILDAFNKLFMMLIFCKLVRVDYEKSTCHTHHFLIFSNQTKNAERNINFDKASSYDTLSFIDAFKLTCTIAHGTISYGID